MDSIFDDFYDTVAEIELYLELLKKIDLASRPSKIKSDSELLQFISKNDVSKTMKASLYLLLYNLIESTMRAGVEKIYDHLSSRTVHFNELNELFKKRILKDIKSSKIGTDVLFKNTLVCIEKEIIKASFRSNKLFSGNVDKEIIQETASHFGFSAVSDYSYTKHGEKLKNVKDKRNDLAHGNITFRDVGMNCTINDLEDTVTETVYYLQKILSNIKDYLDNELYLSSKFST